MNNFIFQSLFVSQILVAVLPDAAAQAICNTAISGSVAAAVPQQEVFVSANGKYQQKITVTVPDGAIYTIQQDEYVGPNGKGWYQVIKTTINGVIYVKIVDGAGGGNYAHDWAPENTLHSPD